VPMEMAEAPIASGFCLAWLMTPPPRYRGLRFNAITLVRAIRANVAMAVPRHRPEPVACERGGTAVDVRPGDRIDQVKRLNFFVESGADFSRRDLDSPASE